MEARRAFQILAVRIRNEDAKKIVRVHGISSTWDPYGASRFDGKKVRGELDQTVLEHTLRNISYRIPKGRQPCADAPNSEVDLLSLQYSEFKSNGL
ncbi:jg22539 [Pararge aegeria aegeria]|uniref:Jg22539 protein n=1 Tax=Pararge aegeria aegeria TaxID=348720 RepID=A0A8S4QK18_9NEOP|nr:jg22539 [Pararge aegeria aegeria]